MNFHAAKAHFIFSLFAITTLGSLSDPANAQQVYKWQDSKGATHYTQTPPPVGAKSQMVEVRSRVASLQPASSEAKDTAASIAKTTAAEQANSQKKQRLKPEDCMTLRSTLDTLNTGRRIYEADANGERAYLTEEQRAEKISTYSKNLAEGCS